MELVVIENRPVFDTTQAERGDLVYARHRSWEKGRGGILTRVTAEKLTVQYYPPIGNVTNHFEIPISEAAAGQWEIRWSKDLLEIGDVEMVSEESGTAGGSDGGT